MDGESKVDIREQQERETDEETPRHGDSSPPCSIPNHDFVSSTEPKEFTVSYSHSDTSPVDDTGDQILPDELELRDENVVLRRRLAESARGFQGRLDNQTNLISRLQGQLKDSQKRMADMEAAERSATLASLSCVGASASSSATSPAFSGLPITSTPRKPISTGATDELMLKRLLEEQERNATLNDVNMTLRRELDETKVVSVSLTGDLLRVSQEYDRTKREMQNRTEEYETTEKLYLERLASEHRQMLKLWRSFQQLRREYLDCRSMAMRGLKSMESEFQRIWKGSSAACQKLNMWMTYAASARRILDKDGSAAPDAAGPPLMTEGSSVEEMILENVRRLTESQNEKEETIRQLQQRLDEVVEQKQLLESQLVERDRQLETLKNGGFKAKDDKDESYAEYLHNALRDLAERVLAQDPVDSNGDAAAMVSPRRRARSFSPAALRGRAAADTTVRLVREALDRRQRDANELAARLRAAQQKAADLEKSPTTDQADRERLEKELNEVNARVASVQKERDGALQQKENLRTQLAYLRDETLVLERKKRETVEAHAEGLNKNLEEAQKRILQLESAHSRLEDERERAGEDAQRYKGDLAKLKSLLDATQTALSESRDEAASLRSSNSRLERENRDSRSESDAMKENVKKLEAKCDELAAEIDRVTSAEHSANDRHASLLQEKQSLLREREDAARARQILEKRLERMEDDYLEMERKKEAAEADVKTLREELDAFRQMEVVWNQERTLLLGQLEVREGELHEFESGIEAFKQEHAQTDIQLKLALEKQRDLEAQLESCRRNLSSEHEKSVVVFEERQHLLNERTELEGRVSSFVEQVRRYENQERQTEEKYRARLLEVERRLEEADEQKKTSECLILDFTRRVEDAYEEKRHAESRANSLQTVLISQEELLRAKDTEKRNVQSRVAQLEGQLRGREAQLKQISEKFERLLAETEKVDSEKRNIKSELDRVYEDRQRFRTEAVALTDEVQRLRLQAQEAVVAAEADKEKLQSLVDRLKVEEQRRAKSESDADNSRSALTRATESENELRIQLESTETLLSQHSADAQASRDQLLTIQQELRTSEQEKRMLEERLRDAREQLTKSKKELKSRSDDANTIESKAADLERKSMEVDSQLKALQKMLAMSQETEADLKHQLENAVGQKRSFQTRFGEIQRKLEAVESQKREFAGHKAQADRDLASSRRQLALYEDELRKNEKALEAAVKEREAMDKALRAMEKENMQLQSTVTQLQSQVTRMEQSHSQRMSELQRFRAELEDEHGKAQAERQESLRKVELLEKVYERRLESKDGEIKRLQEQLRTYWRNHKDYVSKYVEKSRDVADLRSGLAELNAGMESSFVRRNDSSLAPSISSPPGSPALASTPLKRSDATASPLNSTKGGKNSSNFK